MSVELERLSRERHADALFAASPGDAALWEPPPGVQRRTLEAIRAKSVRTD